jgi:hypothetical protein
MSAMLVAILAIAFSSAISHRFVERDARHRHARREGIEQPRRRRRREQARTCPNRRRAGSAARTPAPAVPARSGRHSALPPPAAGARRAARSAGATARPFHHHQPQRPARHVHPVAQRIGAEQRGARLVAEDIDQRARIDRIDMLRVERQPLAGEPIGDARMDRAQPPGSR